MATRVLLFSNRAGRLAPLGEPAGKRGVPASPKVGLDLNTALSLAARHRPDVALVDCEVADRECMETVRRLAARSPGTRILVRAKPLTSGHVTRLIRAGASGFLNANRMRPGAPLSLPAAFAPTDGTAISRLTPREREVLQLIAEGHSTKQIAYRLHVSHKTVESHREHLTSKLNIKSIARLTKFAVREGLTSIEG